MLQTVFLDAGGVLVFLHWSRIEEAMARQGVDAAAERLARAEPFVRKQLDDSRAIGTTTDAGRGWFFFDLILEHADTRDTSEHQCCCPPIVTLERYLNKLPQRSVLLDSRYS